jgi:ATP-dependent Clp protease protease subunit
MDAMKLNRCDIATYCVGICASMATVLLSAGTPGKRYAMPNSTIHMHQVLGGAQGQASDIEIEAREAIRLNDMLRQILAKNTGQDEERIRRDADRNYYLTAQQAVEYGLVDEILNNPVKALV